MRRTSVVTAFAAPNAMPSSPAFGDQPKQGRITGFDFYRDPLNVDEPMTTFEEAGETTYWMEKPEMIS